MALTYTNSESIPESESESTPEGQSLSRSRLKAHRLRSPGGRDAQPVVPRGGTVTPPPFQPTAPPEVGSPPPFPLLYLARWAWGPAQDHPPHQQPRPGPPEKYNPFPDHCAFVILFKSSMNIQDNTLTIRTSDPSWLRGSGELFRLRLRAKCWPAAPHPYGPA